MRAEHKHGEDESPVCEREERKKCLPTNGREISVEGKTKGILKQKQDESLSF